MWNKFVAWPWLKPLTYWTLANCATKDHEQQPTLLVLTLRNHSFLSTTQANKMLITNCKDKSMYILLRFWIVVDAHWQRLIQVLLNSHWAIFICNNYRLIASDKDKLQSMKVTHIVNCAQGSKINQINTDAEYFKDVNIGFHGICIMDSASCDMTPHLAPAVDFMEDALTSEGRHM